MSVASHREGRWLGTPNCTPGREGNPVTVVVLHTMVTDVAGANKRFQNTSLPMQDRKSVGYGIGSDGSVVQWVDEADGAWHAGTWAVNMTSIGIEHDDSGDAFGVRSDALYAASAGLVRRICRRYGLPIDRQHVKAHRDVWATGCPDTLDVDRIVREAATDITIPSGDDVTRILASATASPFGSATFAQSDPATDNVTITAWDHGTGNYDVQQDTKGQLVDIHKFFYDGLTPIMEGLNKAGERWMLVGRSWRRLV